MNKIYKLVWDKELGEQVVSSELSKNNGKGKRGICGGKAINFLSAMFLIPTLSLANPSGGTVTSGNSVINSVGTTTTITQSSANTSINWDSFNIGADESVKFIQPSKTSVAVNRVIGNSASEIYGKLDANGQIYLINGNGIVFEKGSQINVGGLVASTLDTTGKNTDGSYSFSGKAGEVLNNGTINVADGGSVALMGGQVSNNGVISGRLGSINMGSGTEQTLSFDSNGLMSVAVTKGANNALVENTGTIKNDGGKVLMTAQTANDLISASVNNDGVIEAKDFGGSDGSVILYGDMKNGETTVTGTIDVSSDIGGNGGVIELDGSKVFLGDTASITAKSTVASKSGSVSINSSSFTIGTDANASSSVISDVLNNGDLTINAASDDVSVPADIAIKDAISWSENTKLSLNAENTISIEKGSVSLSGANAEFDIAATNGFFLSSDSHIDLSSSTQKFSIDGKQYQIITSNNLSSVINDNDKDGKIAGFYALGVDINGNNTIHDSIGLTSDGPDVYMADFTGVFNGLGHKISNYKITESGVDPLAVGLFGSNSGVISNLNISGFEISNTSGGETGAIAGKNTGSINSITISNSVITGQNNVGGITGSNETDGFIDDVSISNTFVNGVNRVGGVVGYNKGELSMYSLSNNFIQTNSSLFSSTSFSDIGGAVGLNSGVMTDGYLQGYGTIGDNTTAAVYTNIGGIVGENNGVLKTVEQADDNKLGNGYEVKGTVNVGGIAGKNTGNISDATITHGYVYGLQNTGGAVGYSTGIIDANGNVVLASISDSIAQMNIYDYSDSTLTHNNMGGFIGFNDINSEIKNSGALSYLNTRYSTNYIGGFAGNNFGNINNSYSIVDIDGTSGRYVGGFVGRNEGDIDYSFSSGNILADTSVSTRFAYVGGFSGVNSDIGVITNSFSRTNLTGQIAYVGGFSAENYGVIDKAYASGYIDAINKVGGFVYENSGTISNAYSNGEINLNSISGISLGATRGYAAGGFVYLNSGTISKSYSLNTINFLDLSNPFDSTRDLVGGFAAKNTGVIDSVFWSSENSGVSTFADETNTINGTNVSNVSISNIYKSSYYNDIDWISGNKLVWHVNTSGNSSPMLLTVPLVSVVTAASSNLTSNPVEYGQLNSLTYDIAINETSGWNSDASITAKGAANLNNAMLSTGGYVNAGLYSQFISSGARVSSTGLDYQMAYMDSLVTVKPKE